jgi:16S rRNA (cytosine1402-N4)-methyltransferase
MQHRPVMLAEALAYLIPTEGATEGGTFVDATLGMGGHTEAILRSSPSARVIGLDRDGDALEIARSRLSEFGERFRSFHADYRELKQLLIDNGITSVVGILADLGVSSYQLDTPERGFSFRSGETTGAGLPPEMRPLDMRMDRRQRLTAEDLVNDLSERELADIIWQFGEERGSRRIARRIVDRRTRARITSTAELAEIVVKALHPKGRWTIHPATRTFMALRIAVNRELEGLDQFVADAIDALEMNGRLVVITFHSLEDRAIKQALRFQAGQCICSRQQPAQLFECRCGTRKRIELLTRKPVSAGPEELRENPRARSARLRAARKIGF